VTVLTQNSNFTTNYKIMAVRHTLIKKTSTTAKVQTLLASTEKTQPMRSEKSENRRRPVDENGLPIKKNCLYCELKKEPTYTDVITLRKCLSERALIMPKQRTGACSKHQRRITRQLKYARHLSLLPFVNKI